MPDHADVQLAAVDELLDDRRRENRVVDVLHALDQLLLVGDHGGLRNPDRRLVGERLDDHRIRELLRQHRLAVERHDREVGRRDPVIGQQLPRQRFVSRQRQAARVAAGVRHAASTPGS